MGAGQAMVTLQENCSGDYVISCDADDYWNRDNVIEMFINDINEYNYPDVIHYDDTTVWDLHVMMLFKKQVYKDILYTPLFHFDDWFLGKWLKECTNTNHIYIKNKSFYYYDSCCVKNHTHVNMVENDEYEHYLKDLSIRVVCDKDRESFNEFMNINDDKYDNIKKWFIKNEDKIFNNKPS